MMLLIINFSIKIRFIYSLIKVYFDIKEIIKMKNSNLLKIGPKTISDDHPTYFIADIGANHDGNLKELRI